jgi:hypothetical protein
MSAGCVVIGSDTAPVREVIEPNCNGILVPFFAVDELAERVVEALQDPAKFVPIRETARQYVIENFDAERICVPQIRRLLEVEQETPAQPEVPPVSPARFADPMPAAAEIKHVLSSKELLRNLLRELDNSGT